MGSAALWKAVLLFNLVVSASLFSTSSAGMARKFVSSPAERIGAASKEMPNWYFHRGEETGVYQRMLNVKTNDYGRYDPSPGFVKPPFKLIPN